MDFPRTLTSLKTLTLDGESKKPLSLCSAFGRICRFIPMVRSFFVPASNATAEGISPRPPLLHLPFGGPAWRGCHDGGCVALHVGAQCQRFARDPDRLREPLV